MKARSSPAPSGHSIVLTLMLGVLVVIQQYLIPWIIPVVGGQ